MLSYFYWAIGHSIKLRTNDLIIKKTLFKKAQIKVTHSNEAIDTSQQTLYEAGRF
jgi:hypothetical protein